MQTGDLRATLRFSPVLILVGGSLHARRHMCMTANRLRNLMSHSNVTRLPLRPGGVDQSTGTRTAISLEVEVDGSAPKGDDAVLSLALESSDALRRNAENAQESGDGRGVSLESTVSSLARREQRQGATYVLDRVAALHLAGVALATRSSEEGKGEEEGSGGTSEHGRVVTSSSPTRASFLFANSLAAADPRISATRNVHVFSVRWQLSLKLLTPITETCHLSVHAFPRAPEKKKPYHASSSHDLKPALLSASQHDSRRTALLDWSILRGSGSSAAVIHLPREALRGAVIWKMLVRSSFIDMRCDVAQESTVSESSSDLGGLREPTENRRGGGLKPPQPTRNRAQATSKGRGPVVGSPERRKCKDPKPCDRKRILDAGIKGMQNLLGKASSTTSYPFDPHRLSYFTMFARLSAAVLLALPLLAAAGGQCNTGEMQCCNSVQNADTPSVAALLGVLGVAAQGVTGQVGVTCSPISVIGGGGNSCTAQPVCCSNNSFNGIVALGCTPINLNL
ncbi:putative hydrophobins [Lyophyllum shimeji]|uniref:Hydrophobins n=1 Tax=Lyophyllum shimeji TaxID=47721 RepID=A0A9P3UNQ2_LYOSH|nr:putative hydrophobins [Lyophyllum shimeji]